MAANRKPKIVISSFTFTVPGHVRAGAKVRIVNNDKVEHTVTSDDGTSFDVDVPGKSTTSFLAPATAGSYDFHCNFHLSMHGTLVVK